MKKLNLALILLALGLTGCETFSTTGQMVVYSELKIKNHHLFGSNVTYTPDRYDLTLKYKSSNQHIHIKAPGHKKVSFKISKDYFKGENNRIFVKGTEIGEDFDVQGNLATTSIKEPLNYKRKCLLGDYIDDLGSRTLYGTQDVMGHKEVTMHDVSLKLLDTTTHAVLAEIQAIASPEVTSVVIESFTPCVPNAQ